MDPSAPSTAASSLPTVIRTPPSLDAYTPLAEHLSRTPTSFFDGPPVLHYHGTGAKAYVSREQQEKFPWGSSGGSGAAVNGTGADEPVMGDDMVAHSVDVFVASDTLVLYSPTAGSGISLPYPVIGLHAIKSAYTADGARVPTVYMQLEMSGTDNDYEDTVELTLVPVTQHQEAPVQQQPPPPDVTAAAAVLAVPTTQPPPSTPANNTPITNNTPTANNTPARSNTPTGPNTDSSSSTLQAATRLFDAISACADLHPDRFGDDDDEDDEGSYPSFIINGADGEGDGDEEDGILFENGGMEPVEGFQGVFHNATRATAADLPPPMPGSSGWITAENAHEFFDEDGNWRGGNAAAAAATPLGQGAGRVRGRDEAEAASADQQEEGEGTPTAEGVLNGQSTTTTTTTTATAAPTAPEGGSNGDGTESKRLRTE